MATEGGGSGSSPFGRPAEWNDEILSWRRFGEFVRNILRLERSVEALKKENAELDARFAALQRQFDEQTGQLAVLLEFVNKALDERVEWMSAWNREPRKLRSEPSSVWLH